MPDRITDERLEGHDRFAKGVKQSCEHWHRARGRSPETLASDNTYDLACRLLEAIAEVRQMHEAELNNQRRHDDESLALRRKNSSLCVRIAELKAEVEEQGAEIDQMWKDEHGER